MMSGEKRKRWTTRNETAGRFVDTLAAYHAVGNKGKPSGLLNNDVLERLKEFIVEHLDEPLDVATLAKMTNRSQFHFSRAFTRSVGVSPYQYVIHLRLQHAVELVAGAAIAGRRDGQRSDSRRG
jgi:AraC family transcriptional regulator